MYQHLQRALLSIGFLHPQNPDHLMFALRRLFGRTELEDHEVRILLGMARQIEWAGTQIVTGDRLPAILGAPTARLGSHQRGPRAVIRLRPLQTAESPCATSPWLTSFRSAT